MEQAGAFVGHGAEVLALAASDSLLLSGAEDGARLWSVKDRTCIAVLQAPHTAGSDEVAAVALSPTDDHAAFTASGEYVRFYDLRSTAAPVAEVELGADDIGQLAVHHKGKYLALADDSGAARVIEISTKSSYKTIRRNGHSSICSSVQFRPGKQWELLTGGLDSTVNHWDFSRPRKLQGLTMTSPQLNAAQMCNPPFVYGLATTSNGKQAAAALGDGTVALLNFTGAKGRVVLERRLSGGHSTSVSQVLFPKYAKDELLVSAGNDAKICLWNMNRMKDAGGDADGGGSADAAAASEGNGDSDDSKCDAIPTSTLKHTAKINWLASASTNTLFVADTSPIITDYTLPP